MLWYVYDRIWADGRLEFISGAQLVKRLGVSLRSARDGLRILERRGFLRCLTRGGGRGVAKAYRLGNGPGPEASNVVQLQSRERKHNQKTMLPVAPFTSETVQPAAPFKTQNGAKRSRRNAAVIPISARRGSAPSTHKQSKVNWSKGIRRF